MEGSGFLGLGTVAAEQVMADDSAGSRGLFVQAASVLADADAADERQPERGFGEINAEIQSE